MAVSAPHERLKRARAERAEDIAALSARTGLRVQHVRAIEDGRFADLPSGIYGRAAIRTFAAAYGLDADEVLADCEPLLPRLVDPIGALARLHGIATAAPPRELPVVAPLEAPAPAASAPARPGWRPFAAMTLDAAIVGSLVVVMSVGAALQARVPVPALGSSSISLAVVGLLLGGAYFVWLGGLAGTTIGEFTVGPEPHERDPRPLTLRAIALRSVAVATADARAIRALGERAGRGLTPAGARSAQRRAPSPLPLQSRGRASARS